MASGRRLQTIKRFALTTTGIALGTATTGWRRLVAVAVGLGLVVSVAGCGSGDSTVAERGYVGTLQGTDAFVFVIAAGGEALVYVCNGDEGILEWFQGTIDDPTELALTNDAGASVQAAYTNKIWQGSVTLADGSTNTFATVEAEDGSGLYRVDDEDADAERVWAAWIIDNEGNERGAVLRRGSLVTPTPTFVRPSLRFSFGGSTFTVGYQGTDGADTA